MTSIDIVKLKMFVYLSNVPVSSRSQITDDGSYGSPHTDQGMDPDDTNDHRTLEWTFCFARLLLAIAHISY